MKKVFLTGGAGFIGSHLVTELLAKNIEVTVFDNLSTGKLADIEQHRSNPGCNFIRGDVKDRSALEKGMAGHDVVWHLAANTMIPAGISDHGLDLYENIIGTWNVLEAMLASGVKQILFASTAAAYGDEPETLLTEKHGPMRPISLYGASKLGAEAFISAYSHLFGIEAWSFRFGNVVGGGMGHGVIFDLIQKLKRNPQMLEIWGDGQGHKPYFLVEDCIRGMLCAYHERFESGVNKHCDVYNLGTPTTTTVDEVARIVIEEMRLENVTLVHTGGRHGFPGDVPDVNYRAEKMESMGWTPSHTSDEAVRIAARRIISGFR